MPNLDTYFKGGRKVHILDRNKYNSNKTLCGQAIYNDTNYVADEAVTEVVNCKVCRKQYFGESVTEGES